MLRVTGDIYSLVRGALRSVGIRRPSADLVQSAALACVQAAPKWRADGGASITTYLYSYARWAGLDWLRSEARAAAIPALAQGDSAYRGAPWAELTEATVPSDRALLWAYFGAGGTYAEIGASLGISRTQVHRRVSRALESICL